MTLEDAIVRGTAIQRNARGPKKSRGWQKMPPPEDPSAQRINHGSGIRGQLTPDPLSLAPPPVTAGLGVPQRPLPPIAIGYDSLRQFEAVSGIPKRRVFGPTPL